MGIFDIVFNFYKERKKRKLTKVVDQVNSDYDKLYDLKRLIHLINSLTCLLTL